MRGVGAHEWKWWTVDHTQPGHAKRYSASTISLSLPDLRAGDQTDTKD